MKTTQHLTKRSIFILTAFIATVLLIGTLYYKQKTSNAMPHQARHSDTPVLIVEAAEDRGVDSEYEEVVRPQSDILAAKPTPKSKSVSGSAQQADQTEVTDQSSLRDYPSIALKTIKHMAPKNVEPQVEDHGDTVLVTWPVLTSTVDTDPPLLQDDFLIKVEIDKKTREVTRIIAPQ